MFPRGDNRPGRRAAAAAVLFAVPLLLSSCGDSDGGAPPPPGAGPTGTGEPTAGYAGDPIAESMPLEVTLPRLGISQVVDETMCPMTPRGLDPVDMMAVCFYTADDKPYVLPSTDQPDVTVLAGHAGSYVPGIFDDVYDAANDTFAVREGDELRVRTEASGDKWLVYRATDFHVPDKTELAGSGEVWGDAPTPGRLLLLTCLQPEDFSQPALRNAVVGYQFHGVADDGGM